MYHIVTELPGIRQNAYEIYNVTLLAMTVKNYDISLRYFWHILFFKTFKDSTATAIM